MEGENIISINLLLFGFSSSKRKFLKMIGEEKQISKLATVGIIIIDKFIEYNNQLIKIKIFDNNQERFKCYNFKDSESIFFIYSINNKGSFYFISEIIKKDLIKPIQILIGIDNNKNRSVSYDEGNNLAKRINIPFFEININNKNFTNEIFFKFIELYCKKYKIIYNNNINYITKFFVNCSLNNCSNYKEFLIFTESKLCDFRLKNMKKYTISFITHKYIQNLNFVDGGIYLVNLWNIDDFYNLKNELNQNLPNIPKMILGLSNSNERKINKIDIMDLVKIFKIAYFEINLLNSKGFEIAFHYLIMEMISYSGQSKNNDSNTNAYREKSNTKHKKKDKCEIY